MNRTFAFLIVLMFFSLGFSDVHFPQPWYSFRGDTLTFGAGLRGGTDEAVHYELLMIDENGKYTHLFSRTIRPAQEQNEWTVSFTGLRRDVVGRNSLWLKQSIGSQSPTVHGPFGFIKTPLIETADTAFVFEGDVRNFALSVGETHKFAHNQNGLIIAIGDSETDITISLDLANSKTAFLAFSNRKVIFRAENRSVEFHYPERNTTILNAIQYRLRNWEGDMRVFDSANGKIVFIPWFDLGIRYEIGRRFGFAVHGDNFTQPENASRHSPASWGNIILR